MSAESLMSGEEMGPEMLSFIDRYKHFNQVSKELPIIDDLLIPMSRHVKEIGKGFCKSSKIFSKKNKVRIEAISYAMSVPDKNTMVYFKVKCSKFGLGFTNIVLCHGYKTSRGTCYYFQTESGVVFCVLAHVLDRFSQRAFGGKLSRERALRELAGSLVGCDVVRACIDLGYKVDWPIKEGVLMGRAGTLERLGDSYIGYEIDSTEMRGQDFHKFVMFKTFVTHAMLKKSQSDKFTDPNLEVVTI